jgi:hypothetical protein
VRQVSQEMKEEKVTRSRTVTARIPETALEENQSGIAKIAGESVNVAENVRVAAPIAQVARDARARGIILTRRILQVIVTQISR